MRALAIATPYAIPVVLLLAAFSARAEDPVTAAGKQRAAASRIEWDIREASHPILGSIRFAYMKSPVVTAVGISRLYSNVYVSCATNGRTIAFEVTNQAAPDDPGGLQPATPPHLVCKSPAPKGGTVQDAIAASWHVNELGDALASGYSPHKLRGCATIAIVEDVALPKGWAQAYPGATRGHALFEGARFHLHEHGETSASHRAPRPWGRPGPPRADAPTCAPRPTSTRRSSPSCRPHP